MAQQEMRRGGRSQSCRTLLRMERMEQFSGAASADRAGSAGRMVLLLVLLLVLLAVDDAVGRRRRRHLAALMEASVVRMLGRNNGRLLLELVVVCGVDAVVVRRLRRRVAPLLRMLLEALRMHKVGLLRLGLHLVLLDASGMAVLGRM